MANIITELHLEMSDNWYVTKKLNSIGRVGENTVTKLIIEPTEILDNVTYEIEIMSADGSKNVAELTVDGTELYLILSANMLTTSGITKMQVRGLFTDGSVKKSNIFELKVNRSISATEHYEEYAVTIFDQLVQDCRDIIEGAESYAVRAETAAVNAGAYEQSASASAQAASTAANNASTSATAAANSATAASNSATSASASATSAVTSETNAAASAALASTSAANANTSATNAANSATSAATSASNAAVSATNASASEANASTSAAEAEASAESIAASVAQINENTYRINDLEAIIAGYQQADLPTGAVASVTDGTALLMPSLKVGIEPVQDLHGYDHPWAGGAGKNLFDLSTMINGLYSDENFTVIQDTSTVYRSYKYYLKAGTYTFSASKKVRILRSVIDGVYSSSQSDLPYTFSITSDGYVGFSFRNKDDTDWNINTNCQIELGNQVTSYEPYSNICPISGWTAANVTRTGKNLADFVQNKNISIEGTISDYPGRAATVKPIIIENGVNYVFKHFSEINDIVGIIAVYNGDALVRREASIRNNTQLNVSGGDRFYFCIYIASEQITVDDAKAMIVKSTDTATTYEPYNGTTYNVQFTDGTNPLTVYGGTLDVTTGELVVDRVSVDLGTLSWSTASTGRHIVGKPTDIKIVPNITVMNGACSQYILVSGNASATTDSSICMLNGSLLQINDSNLNGTDAESFKTAMNGVQFVYELATPLTYQLTPTQVRTLVGNNNIWADTGDVLSGKYFKEL